MDSGNGPQISVMDLLQLYFFFAGLAIVLHALLSAPIIVLYLGGGVWLCARNLDRGLTALLYLYDWFRTTRRRGN